jgi:hypothetical protein
LVNHNDPVLPVTVQCRLLKVARSTLYYPKSGGCPFRCRPYCCRFNVKLHVIPRSDVAAGPIGGP